MSAVRIKRMLDELIDYAYPDDKNRRKEYKRFYIEIRNADRKSMHGVYHSEAQHIVIYNLERNDAMIVKTCIHELAHHIDFCQRLTTDHSNSFYAVYKILLYAALDMKLINKYDIINNQRDSSDYNKVVKMIQTYRPKYTGYKAGKQLVSVYNAYKFKDVLKERSYTFSSINKTWEKETELPDEEVEFLENIHAEYKVEPATSISFKKKTYIYGVRNTYSYKDQLKRDGFHYSSKTNAWSKEGTKEDMQMFQAKYPEIVWVLK